MAMGVFCIGIGIFAWFLLSNTVGYGSGQGQLMSCVIASIFIFGGIISIVSSSNSNKKAENDDVSNEIKKDDNTEKILSFKKLFDEGIITQEEFEKKKKEILNL